MAITFLHRNAHTPIYFKCIHSLLSQAKQSEVLQKSINICAWITTIRNFGGLALPKNSDAEPQMLQTSMLLKSHKSNKKCKVKKMLIGSRFRSGYEMHAAPVAYG